MMTKSYSRTCKKCGRKINMRQMPAGQWVAFEGYDQVHDCSSPSYSGKGYKPAQNESSYSNPGFADFTINRQPTVASGNLQNFSHNQKAGYSSNNSSNMYNSSSMKAGNQSSTLGSQTDQTSYSSNSFTSAPNHSSTGTRAANSYHQAGSYNNTRSERSSGVSVWICAFLGLIALIILLSRS